MFKKKNKDLKELKKQKKESNKNLNYKLYTDYLLGNKRLKDLSFLERQKMKFKLLRYAKNLAKKNYDLNTIMQFENTIELQKKILQGFIGGENEKEKIKE